MIKDVLRMGDERLLLRSLEVERLGSSDTAAMLQSLLTDMRDTMAHLNGAGLAAPQIGVNLRVVIFGVKANPRYPDAEEVPDTVLINPVLEPMSEETEEGWEGCLSVPGMRGLVPRGQHLDMPDLLNSGRAAGFKIGLYPIHEYWTDLGRPTKRWISPSATAHRSRRTHSLLLSTLRSCPRTSASTVSSIRSDSSSTTSPWTTRSCTWGEHMFGCRQALTTTDSSPDSATSLTAAAAQPSR